MSKYHLLHFKYFLIVFPVLFTSCSKVQNLQPENNENIPAAVIQLVTDKYPNAKEVTFKSVEKDQLWEARYTSDGIVYYAALNTDRILVAYKFVSPIVADTLKQTFLTLKVNGGTFSNFRQIIEDGNKVAEGDTYNKYYIADYTLNGISYVASWYIPWDIYSGKHLYRIALDPYYKFRYGSSQLTWKNNATDFISAYIERKNLSVVSLYTSVGEDNKRIYDISAMNYGGTLGSITLSDNVLLHTSLTNDNAMYRMLDDCPAWLQSYVRSSPDYNSNFISSLLFNQYSDSDFTSYALIIGRTITGNNSEGYTIYFDQNEKMTKTSYYGYVYF